MELGEIYPTQWRRVLGFFHLQLICFCFTEHKQCFKYTVARSLWMMTVSMGSVNAGRGRQRKDLLIPQGKLQCHNDSTAFIKHRTLYTAVYGKAKQTQITVGVKVIKRLYIETYKNRLAPRPMKQKYEDIYQLKNSMIIKEKSMIKQTQISYLPPLLIQRPT